MDRDRLKDVHQQELTESRINEDFVLWLKTKGPSWLAIILIAISAYIAMMRWGEHKTRTRDLAWAELNLTVALAQGPQQLPSTYEDIAVTYEGIDAVAVLGRLLAADVLLRCVQTNRALDSSPGLPKPLLPEDRVVHLGRADALYGAVVQADDATIGTALFTFTALQGRGAVAESNGEHESARGFHKEAAARVAAQYPGLAAQARRRAETTGQYATMIDLPAAGSSTPSTPFAPDRRPVLIEPVLLGPLLDAPGS